MKRVQRKRTAGWRMPPNTIYVGRPTKWGNPYKLSEYPLHQVLQLYENWIRVQLLDHPCLLDELKGKDLACWCPLDKPCHVDVILKILSEMQENIDHGLNADGSYLRTNHFTGLPGGNPPQEEL